MLRRGLAEASDLVEEKMSLMDSPANLDAIHNVMRHHPKVSFTVTGRYEMIWTSSNMPLAGTSLPDVWAGSSRASGSDRRNRMLVFGVVQVSTAPSSA